MTCSRPPDWRPLETLFPEFGQSHQLHRSMYMGGEGALLLYKHANTRRYLRIHPVSLKCYVRAFDGELWEVSPALAVARFLEGLG